MLDSIFKQVDTMYLIIGLLLVGFVIYKLKIISFSFGRSYKSRFTLLTQAELNFYKQLKRNLPDGYSAQQKVRLADVVEPINRNDLKLWHRVQAKHIDFVICEDSTSRIILAIELDDSSHSSSSAFKRDSEKNEALKAGGVPLVRVRCTRSYSKSVFTNISSYLKNSGKSNGKPNNYSSKPKVELVNKAISLPSTCPRCGKEMSIVKMSFPNKGYSFSQCDNCGYRTEPV